MEDLYERTCRKETQRLLQSWRDAGVDMEDYSPLHLASICWVMECTIADAKLMLDFMDTNYCHPDWSEADWYELKDTFHVTKTWMLQEPVSADTVHHTN